MKGTQHACAWMRPHSATILDTVTDGVYVVDCTAASPNGTRAPRPSPASRSSSVLGSTCGDTMLCHVTEDGRILCTEGCPWTPR